MALTFFCASFDHCFEEMIIFAPKNITYTM